MYRFLIATLLCFTFVYTAAAQTSADSPATKEDVDKYLQVIHAHQMMHQMTDAMIKPMHQMLHDQFMKDQDKLPPDFEQRMTQRMDDMMKTMPWDDMLDAMVPAYQKHFTKGDMDALVGFYSTPRGQKILGELPAVTAEAMQAMMPLIRKQMDAMTSQIQAEVAEMKKNAKKPVPESSQSK